MSRRPFFILSLIVLLAFVLRFYQLGNIPVGFHRDEAFFGYNAFSLLQTGRDMTGDIFPLHLQSFLYSPAGYSYFIIPFISIFGMNEFAVRLPAAFFGTLTILMTYFLVKELLSLLKRSEDKSNILPLLSALFLAISPWHINLSRVATENILVVFFITLGIWFYLKWIKKKKFWVLLLAFFCFGLTLILYQAPRAFLPFFIPLLFVCFHPQPWKKNIIMPTILLTLIIIIPIIAILSSHDLTQRIRMLSVFQNPATQLVLDEQIREDAHGEGGVLTTRFFHNKISNYSITFFSNYFSHFSYDFLFLDKGFPDRYRVPHMGLLYFFEILFLVVGVWKLFQNQRRIALFLFGWVLFAPLGSALTYDDVPNLQRTLLIFPALSIISAFGFWQVWQMLGQIKFANVARIVVLLIMFYGILYYFHQYYIHQVYHRPWYRQEGYKALVQQLKDYEARFKKIIISDVETDPSIFFLFYNVVNPTQVQKYLANSPTETYGLMPLGNYQFIKDPCPLHLIPSGDPTKQSALSGEKDILYVNSGNCKDMDERVETLSQIKRSDGTIVFSLQVVKQ